MPNTASLKLITTEDGSHTLYREDMNETYHSMKGALGESKHVFLDAGLNFFLSKSDKKEVSILEVGFGTGLNCLLCYQQTEVLKESRIHYIGLEPYPISLAIAEKLNYEVADRRQFLKMHQLEFDQLHSLSDHFTLRKIKQKLENYYLEDAFDVLFFDAFAPSKQPELWSLENIRKCYKCLHEGGVLVTYSASGQFKRNLKEAGFTLEVLPGAMGKKEMVRALRD